MKDELIKTPLRQQVYYLVGDYYYYYYTSNYIWTTLY